MSADTSLQVMERSFSPVTVWRNRGRQYLTRFQSDVAVLRATIGTDLLKNTVVLTDNFASDTDVVDVMFHKNTPTLSLATHTPKLQKFH
jgi:hypothetical protein